MIKLNYPTLEEFNIYLNMLKEGHKNHRIDEYMLIEDMLIEVMQCNGYDLDEVIWGNEVIEWLD